MNKLRPIFTTIFVLTMITALTDESFGEHTGHEIPDTINDLTATLSANTVTLSWSQPSSPTDFVNIEINKRVDSTIWRQACGFTSSSETTCTENVADGFEYDYRVRIENANGWSQWSNIVEIVVPDSTPPGIIILNPSPSKIFTTNSITVSGTAFDVDSGIDRVFVSLDGLSDVRATGTTAWSYTFSELNEGNHTLDVYAYNGDNLRTDAPVTFFSVDTIAPLITLNPPNPQIIELGSGYTELGATTDDGSLVTINNSTFTDAVGSYFIYYDSVDFTGNNATQVIRTVNVVDSTPPKPTPTIPPRITVTVNAIGGDDTFKIKIHSPTEVSKRIKLTTVDGTATYPSYRLLNGTTYGIFEFNVPDGFTLTSSICTNNGVPSNVDFVAQNGDIIVCTFTNLADVIPTPMTFDEFCVIKLADNEQTIADFVCQVDILQMKADIEELKSNHP